MIAVEERRCAVTVRLDDDRSVWLPGHYVDAGHLRHAYALTGHKTQGLTVERAFVLAEGEGRLREWGYVALSRARSETRLYAVGREVDPTASPHRIEPAGPLERLADALTRSAAQTLAVDAALSTSPAVLGRRSRLLADRQQALEKQRTSAARELHQAERRREGLGLVGRARYGRVLRDRIHAARERLVDLDRELQQLDRDLRTARCRAFEHARTQPWPERDLTRTPGIERAPQRTLDRGIEL